MPFTGGFFQIKVNKKNSFNFYSGKFQLNFENLKMNIYTESLK